MATLRYVREIKDTKLLLLGIVGEGESADYTVDLSLYEEIGAPSVGDELGEAVISALAFSDGLYRARKKALSILAYADNNRRTLKDKLYRAGFSREVCDIVCEEMINHGYVNEKNQLERLILTEANQKLRGPGRIAPALVSKGYSLSDVKEIMSALVNSGKIDFKKNAKALIEKKLPEGADSEEIKKLLYKNGYKI